MLVGHLAVGLFAKRIDRTISLGTLVLAVLLADLLWPVFTLAGYRLMRHNPRGAWALFGAVVSHWVLDVVTHRPDMPLAPGVQRHFGFGLWASIPATVVLEGGVCGWRPPDESSGETRARADQETVPDAVCVVGFAGSRAIEPSGFDKAQRGGRDLRWARR